MPIPIIPIVHIIEGSGERARSLKRRRNGRKQRIFYMFLSSVKTAAQPFLRSTAGERVRDQWRRRQWEGSNGGARKGQKTSSFNSNSSISLLLLAWRGERVLERKRRREGEWISNFLDQREETQRKTLRSRRVWVTIRDAGFAPFQ